MRVSVFEYFDLTGCSTIILSAYCSEHYLNEALAGGAVGYVHKDTSASELLHAIRTVVNGEVYVCESLGSSALELSLKRHGIAPGDGDKQLTSRESQVLGLSAHGKTTIEIADGLSISRRTVEAHRANMMKKLNLKTQTDLIRYALRTKIVQIR